MLLLSNHLIITSSFFSLAIALSPRTADFEPVNAGRNQRIWHFNYLRCPRGAVPETKPRTWPQNFTPSKYPSVLSLCATSDTVDETVGCRCRNPFDKVRCTRREAGIGFHIPPTINFCHHNCECGRLDDAELDVSLQHRPGLGLGSSSASDVEDLIDVTLDDLNDLSMENEAAVLAGFDEALQLDDAEWTAIDTDGDEGTSSSVQQQQQHQQPPQSPDVIAAIAAAIGTSMSGFDLLEGDCAAGSSSQTGGIGGIGGTCDGGDSIPISTQCNESTCSHYHECIDDASSSVTVPGINVDEDNDDCRCRLGRSRPGEGGKDDWLFLGRCRDKDGLRRRRRRRRRGGEDQGGEEQELDLDLDLDLDLCLCNSTYVSKACCAVKDGMVWEEEGKGLKRGILVRD
jgi:hypothetical protein